MNNQRKETKLMKIEIDQDIYDELISILEDLDREDIISELQDIEYKPPKIVKKDYYSDNEGSAEEESDYEVEIDEEGFHSLK